MSLIYIAYVCNDKQKGMKKLRTTHGYYNIAMRTETLKDMLFTDDDSKRLFYLFFDSDVQQPPWTVIWSLENADLIEVAKVGKKGGKGIKMKDKRGARAAIELILAMIRTALS